MEPIRNLLQVCVWGGDAIDVHSLAMLGARERACGRDGGGRAASRVQAANGAANRKAPRAQAHCPNPPPTHTTPPPTPHTLPPAPPQGQGTFYQAECTSIDPERRTLACAVDKCPVCVRLEHEGGCKGGCCKHQRSGFEVPYDLLVLGVSGCAWDVCVCVWGGGGRGGGAPPPPPPPPPPPHTHTPPPALHPKQNTGGQREQHVWHPWREGEHLLPQIHRRRQHPAHPRRQDDRARGWGNLHPPASRPPARPPPHPATPPHHPPPTHTQACPTSPTTSASAT